MLPIPYPGPGEVVDSWMVEKILGEGGMGCVARAYHVVLQTPVALKFMNPQFMTFPGAVERFINEGKASSLIKSDHVVPVTHAGKTANGTPYLVMECLNGLDLADLLARDGTPGLPVSRAIHFILQVLRGLQAAHAVGIIHRDMKPSNCFVVNNDGEEDFVKILDFGISKVAQPGSASLTQTNSALGTPLYMSPEQARSPRDVDVRSDIYSVGVILYELLSGATPFFSDTGEFTEILFKLFTADAPRVEEKRPDLPPGLADVVHKALAKDVSARYATALELAEALEPFAASASLPIVSKMRGFKPPLKGSIAPPQHLPSSMVAFSQLGAKAGAGTDIMPERPKLGVPKLPGGFTEAMANAPGRVVATPTSNESRARPEEASARTQYPSNHPSQQPPAGASTDLGAARDTTTPMPGAAPKAPVAVIAAAIVGFLAIAGGGVVLATRAGGAGSAAHPDPTSSGATSTSTTVAPPPPRETPPPVPSAVETSSIPTTPSAPSASAAAPASASASSSSAPPSSPKTPPKPRPNAQPGLIPGLDNTIHP